MLVREFPKESYTTEYFMWLFLLLSVTHVHPWFGHYFTQNTRRWFKESYLIFIDSDFLNYLNFLQLKLWDSGVHFWCCVYFFWLFTVLQIWLVGTHCKQNINHWISLPLPNIKKKYSAKDDILGTPHSLQAFRKSLLLLFKKKWSYWQGLKITIYMAASFTFKVSIWL